MDIISKTPIKMMWSLESDELKSYTENQLQLFSLKNKITQNLRLEPYMKETLFRIENCFRNIRRKYYFDGKNTLFNHLNSDHYAIYLYYLSNTVYRSGQNEELAQQIFLLNKALHGADIFYAVNLPEIFLLIHPVGTVIGNANYGNYLVVYQNCSIGSLEDGTYPVFKGENVLFARSAVLGKCNIGHNVVIGANAFILKTDIPDNSTAVGAYPHYKILPNAQSVLERIFRQNIS